MIKKKIQKECKKLRSGEREELSEQLNLIEFRLLAAIRITVFVLNDICKIRKVFKLKKSLVGDREELALTKEGIQEVEI
jgi:hypothetical protein